MRLNVRASLADSERTRDLNKRLFRMVAPRYDAVTRVLSLGRDRVWKDRMVAALPPRAAPVCLDLACGTGDITLRLGAKYPGGLIIGLDLVAPMLARARARCRAPHVHFLRGDMGRIAVRSASVDIVTGGYALRNAGDLRKALAEIHRVLKPGGIASFLDFSRPRGKAPAWLESLLLSVWGGWWGLVFHGNPAVYAYIAASLARFPDRRELAALFRSHGLDVQASCLLFGGIVARITACKSVSGKGAGPVREVP
jgi:demethylmenaquinone methyltransferase/2-methoxy-6-polyprenyl-1,4-benzoquinol methylase